MSAAAIGTNSHALWYMTRGFGLVAMVLLTVTTVLGLAQVTRFSRPGWPRFVVSAVHKNASLVAVVAIVIHVATAVLDTYAPIHLIDAFLPYASQYRPFWTGMGALSLDLMLAVVVTSLVRERIGHRVWRAVHWAAYASWPVAVVHGIGTGSDSKMGWVLFLYLICTVAVLGALWWRLAQGWSPGNAAVRGSALAASLVVPLVVAVWTAGGPLRPGWAKKAGTPTALLTAGATSGATSGATTTSPDSTGTSPPSALPLPLRADLRATETQSGPNSDGLVSITIAGTFTGGASGDLKLVLTGEPADGGVSLTGSQVSLGPTSEPSAYTGHVSQLEGDTVVAPLSGPGGTVTATIELRMARDNDQVRGSLEVSG